MALFIKHMYGFEIKSTIEALRAKNSYEQIPVVINGAG